MAYQRVSDLIDHIRGFHRKLRSAVEDKRGETDDARAELLLSYLEEHERHLERSVAAAAADPGGKGILETWLQYAPNTEMEAAFRDLESPEELDPDELVSRVLQAEDGLVRLYGILEGTTSAERVQQFFRSLLELQDSSARRYARTKLESDDV